MTPSDRVKLQAAIRDILPDGWTATRTGPTERRVRNEHGRDADWSAAVSGVVVRPPAGQRGSVLAHDSVVTRSHRDAPEAERRRVEIGGMIRGMGVVEAGFSGPGWHERMARVVVEAIGRIERNLAGRR